MRQTQSHPQGFLLIQSFCQANIARSLTSTCRAVALLEGRTCAGAQRSSFTPAEGFTHGHSTGHFPRSPCFLTEIYLTRLIQVLDMKEVFPCVGHVPCPTQHLAGVPREGGGEPEHGKLHLPLPGASPNLENGH